MEIRKASYVQLRDDDTWREDGRFFQRRTKKLSYCAGISVRAVPCRERPVASIPKKKKFYPKRLAIA
jgi:hypothetical protein